jgi:hypothetical protein
MESRFLCATPEHFGNIFMDCGTNIGMGRRKLRPVVMKNLLQFFASNELHTAEAGGVVYHSSSHSADGDKPSYVAQQWVSAVSARLKNV